MELFLSLQWYQYDDTNWVKKNIGLTSTFFAAYWRLLSLHTKKSEVSRDKNDFLSPNFGEK